MRGRVNIRNRQRAHPLAPRALGQIVQGLLKDLLHLNDFDIGILLVGPREMERVNRVFLQHEGSTDVITFDYADAARPGRLAGEILICVEEALAQARRFRTSWQSEVVRYAVHGVLHLQGYDDVEPRRRARMKREESRLLRQLETRFRFGSLGRSRRALAA